VHAELSTVEKSQIDEGDRKDIEQVGSKAVEDLVRLQASVD